ncbi:transposase [Candidatus Gottesmanbacteria bacterium]|nr:transposase [Candidatus Gottesmanbacteria bacterium]
MPCRNTVKIYLDGGHYHIYNRGVEKRDIFTNQKDYRMFLRFLKDALSPRPSAKNLKTPVTFKGSTFKGIPRQPKNFSKKVTLLAYCLMPNHFHLLVKQNGARSLHEFMQSLATRYAIYFNKEHERVGGLFQGIYKAVLVNEEPYLLHLSRYIHQNPLEISDDIINAFSSYGDYLGIRKTVWVHPEEILSFFQPGTLPFLKNHNTYKDFVQSPDGQSQTFLGNLVLDETP